MPLLITGKRKTDRRVFLVCNGVCINRCPNLQVHKVHRRNGPLLRLWWDKESKTNRMVGKTKKDTVVWPDFRAPKAIFYGAVHPHTRLKNHHCQ